VLASDQFDLFSIGGAAGLAERSVGPKRRTRHDPQADALDAIAVLPQMRHARPPRTETRLTFRGRLNKGPAQRTGLAGSVLGDEGRAIRSFQPL